MLTNESGQILYSTPGVRLLWNVSKKAGTHYLQSCDLNAKGDGTVADKEFGVSNEKVDGRLRLLADKELLKNPINMRLQLRKLVQTIVLSEQAMVCNLLSLMMAIFLILLPWLD